MTVAAVASYTSYLGNGVQTSFAYPFLLLDAAHLQVYVGGTLTTAYTVTGVGGLTGGTLIFSVAPATSALIQIYRVVPLDQPTAYTAYDVFPAAAHEAALNRLCLQIQQHEEALERKPGFLRTVVSAMRNLAFPFPVPLKLLGWNATGDALTLYDAAVTQVTVDPVTGLAHGKSIATVTATNLAAMLTAGALIPAGVRVLGVTYRCLVSFATSNGLTSVLVGGMGAADGWGNAIGITAGSVTGVASFTRADQPSAINAEDVTVTALGGTFGATGSAKLTAHWQTLTPDA